jgi:hypothetical protein
MPANVITGQFATWRQCNTREICSDGPAFKLATARRHDLMEDAQALKK